MPELESAVRTFVALAFLAIGLSHVVQPRAWARFFMLLAAKGEPGVFAIAMLNLTLGGIIVSLHDVWRGPAMLVTVLGWLSILKAVVYLVAPRLGLRVIAAVTEERSGRFVGAGVALIAVGLAIQLFL